MTSDPKQRPRAFRLDEGHVELPDGKPASRRDDGRVVLLKGFFSDTLPAAPFRRLALLRADGDTYESTIDALTACYGRLSPGGYCVIDDYHAFSDCACAVDEFRAARGIVAPLVRVDTMAVFWVKGRGEPVDALL